MTSRNRSNDLPEEVTSITFGKESTCNKYPKIGSKHRIRYEEYMKNHNYQPYYSTFGEGLKNFIIYINHLKATKQSIDDIYE